MSVYRPITWLVFLTANLVLFLAWMPSQIRMIIWYGLIAQGNLSSMLLVFSLLAFCDAFETLRHYTSNNKTEDKILRMVTRDHPLAEP